MTPNVPSSYSEALRSIQDREFQKTRKHREQQWRANRTYADPQILLFERLLVRRMGNLGVPMFANEVMRSAERQQQLFKDGFSRLGALGPHMSGMAVDIIHATKAWNIDRKAWDLVGHVGEEIIAQEGLSIRWGGHWKSPWDPAHWERIEWRNVPSETIPF